MFDCRLLEAIFHLDFRRPLVYEDVRRRFGVTVEVGMIRDRREWKRKSNSFGWSEPIEVVFRFPLFQLAVVVGGPSLSPAQRTTPFRKNLFRLG